MTPFFDLVLKTLKDHELPYTLGADSLVGYTEGDPLKYSHHLKLYLFPRTPWKTLKFVLSLASKRVFVKPKWEQGHLFFKIRSRMDGLVKDATHVRLIPLRQASGGYTVYLGGHDSFFSSSRLSSEALVFETINDTEVSIPRDHEAFVTAHHESLMSGFYQKHVVAFDSESEKEAVAFMHANVAIMDQVGITYWIEGGTLLGALRDQKLIPWDHDLDFGMIYRSETEMKALIRSLRRVFKVSVRDFPKTDAIWQLGKYRVLKIFPRKFYFFKKDLCLDLFVYYEGEIPGQDEAVYKYVVWDRNAFHLKKYLDEPERMEFYGGSVPIPAQAEQFIEVKYGSTWRTPVKEWNVALDDGSIYRDEDQ